MVEEVFKPLGFVNGKSYEMVKAWTIDDLISALQRKLAREINVARNAQRTYKDDERYWEGYTDALGDVILLLEDLRRERT